MECPDSVSKKRVLHIILRTMTRNATVGYIKMHVAQNSSYNNAECPGRVSKKTCVTLNSSYNNMECPGRVSKKRVLHRNSSYNDAECPGRVSKKRVLHRNSSYNDAECPGRVSKKRVLHRILRTMTRNATVGSPKNACYTEFFVQ